MDKSLTVQQVQRMNPAAKLWLYPELANIPTLSALFDGRQTAIILELLARDVRGGLEGHYVSLLDFVDHVEFYDSLGGKDGRPDGELHLAPMHLRLQEGEAGAIPHLSALLKLDGRRVVWNRTPIQRNAPGIDTCGRHAAVRTRRCDLELPAFIAWLKAQGPDPDATVVALTGM